MLETWYDDKIIIIAINVSSILHIPLSVFYELVLLTSTVMAKLFSVASHRRFFWSNSVHRSLVSVDTSLCRNRAKPSYHVETGSIGGDVIEIYTTY